MPIRFWNFVPDPGEPMGNGSARIAVSQGKVSGFRLWFLPSVEFQEEALER